MEGLKNASERAQASEEGMSFKGQTIPRPDKVWLEKDDNGKTWIMGSFWDKDSNSNPNSHDTYTQSVHPWQEFTDENVAALINEGIIKDKSELELSDERVLGVTE